MGLASMAVAGLLTLMVTWWAGPFAKINKNAYSIFDQRDIVPLGYAAFAFALGVTVGLLIRRTLPAMATTLALFVAARLAFLHLVQPHLIAPAHLSVALDPTSIGGLEIINGGPPTLSPNPPTIPDAWIYSTHIVDKAGHALTPQMIASACPNLGVARGPTAGGGPAPVPQNVQLALQSCVEKLGRTYHLVVTYQPPSHYWTLQWYVLGAFLVAAAILVAVSFWAVRDSPDGAGYTIFSTSARTLRLAFSNGVELTDTPFGVTATTSPGDDTLSQRRPSVAASPANRPQPAAGVKGGPKGPPAGTRSKTEHPHAGQGLWQPP